MSHFEDKIRTCSRCKKQVRIKHNQVGGFWWLSGYTTAQGSTYSGGVCVPCFNYLSGERT